ncbi:MAG: hypothetical protein H0W89_08185, partial [Candidatus Levybacteria bacterium]|nr:hypothetical protein [Candidatus Levybacteria bacterium]
MLDPRYVSEGTTTSEQYLVKLARKSFLSLWCHSNIFIDRKPNKKGDGEELCDLLVVFENHVLIFSDRHCKFKDGENVTLSWSRWYRAAVKESVTQIIGARNWINNNPDRLFLDPSCQRSFPLKLNPTDCRFHLIAVTRGSNSACKKYFVRESNGSLQIDTMISNEDHGEHPFTIGRVLSEEPYIHVLDEFSLEIILHELDTIYDFVNYLEKKEKLLTHPTGHIKCRGEEQLIAIYLTSADTSKSHGFEAISDNKKCVSIDVGFWEFFRQSPQYLAKKLADAKSYIWDNYIESATRPIDASSDGNPITDIFEVEPVLRVMASEPRIFRRQLAQKLVEGKERTVKPGGLFLYFGHTDTFPNTAYVFLTFPCPPDINSFDKYCRIRRTLLEACCIVYLSKLPSALRVIGIASEPFNLQSFPEIKAFSEDLILQHNIQGNDRQKFLLAAEELNNNFLQKQGIFFDKSFDEVTTNSEIEYEYPW